MFKIHLESTQKKRMAFHDPQPATNHPPKLNKALLRDSNSLTTIYPLWTRDKKNHWRWYAKMDGHWSIGLFFGSNIRFQSIKDSTGWMKTSSLHPLQNHPPNHPSSKNQGTNLHFLPQIHGTRHLPNFTEGNGGIIHRPWLRKQDRVDFWNDVNQIFSLRRSECICEKKWVTMVKNIVTYIYIYIKFCGVDASCLFWLAAAWVPKSGWDV